MNSSFSTWIISGFMMIVSVGLLTGCGKKVPDATAAITALQEMQNLATAEYSLTKVVKASDDATWYEWGDRKILLTCEATVKAGIDFSRLDTRYVQISGKRISIQVPEPQIISISLPPEKIKLAYEEIGTFRDRFSVAEQNQLLVQAERQVRNQSEKLGILEDARKNTEKWLYSYLTSLGFTEIDLQIGNAIKLKAD